MHIPLPVIEHPVTATELNTALSCQRRANLEYAHRIRVIARQVPSAALVTGGMFAARRHELFTGVGGPNGPVATTLTEYFNSIKNAPAHQQGDLLKATDRAACLGVATANVVTELFKYPDNVQILGTELSIKTKWRGCSIAARLDSLVYDPVTQMAWVNEDKTTSKKASIRAKTVALEPQSWINMLCARAWLDKNGHSETKLGGIRYTIVQKSRLEFCSKDADFDAYVKRVSDQYKAAANTGDPMVVAASVLFTEPPYWFSTQLRHSEAYANWDIPNHKACFEFGSGQCPFWDRLCRYEESLGTKILADNVGPWYEIKPEGTYEEC